MPTTQKKKPAGGTARTGTKTTRRRKAAAPAVKPFRREAGAAVCLLLAICAALACFRVEAIFISFLAVTLRGLLGYGFWLSVPSLLLCGYILAFHRGRPVRLRTLCALSVPLILAGTVHSLLVPPMPWSASLAQTLWQQGQELRSGGVLGGILAQGFVQVFSQLGACILLILSLVLLTLGAFDRTLLDVADWVFSRPAYEPEPEPEEEAPAPPPRREKGRKEIDIPVEDGPLAGAQPEPFFKPPKLGFFNRKPRVPAPDQMLTGQGTPESEAPCAPEPAAVIPVPAPEPVVPAPAPVSPPPEPAREIPPTKLKREEIAQEAQEIAQHVAQDKGAPPYQYPPLSLLKEGTGEIGGDALAELSANKQRLFDTIRSFGIDATISNVTRGPSVTRYELELDQGVRLNRLTNLADDIALALGASGVRIAPIPDQISMVGIEVPNKLVSPVNIHSVVGSAAFTSNASKVSFAVGKDIGGDSVVGDIAKMPHLLIAGTTGSGKSVCTNSLIISLLYKATPEEVRLIMVDPKMVELGTYNGIPHLLIPVVVDPKKAAGALQWTVTEMMKRYRVFADAGVRDLAAFNALAARTEGMEKMPQIVVIIDELADLMLVAAKEVEESICRVAQMGRASGLHLVIATQRPSADVITGLMKANIPSRIAFAVSSAMESRIILDTQGAEKLVGRGDMLFFPLGAGKPTRVQGCLISDQEVAAVVDFVKQRSTAHYSDEIMQEIEQHAAEKEKGTKGVGGSAPDEVSGEYDELIDAAIEVVVDTGQASVSMLQRRLKLGYARAARLVDQMEERGVVGPFEGSKPRQLLLTKEQWQESRLRQDGGLPPFSSAVGALPEERGEDLPPFDLEDELDRAQEDIL